MRKQVTEDIVYPLLTSSISLASLLAVVYVFLFDRMEYWEKKGRPSDFHKQLIRSIVIAVIGSMTAAAILLGVSIYGARFTFTTSPDLVPSLIVLSSLIIISVLLGLAAVIALHSRREGLI